jgi:hypothetical protein
VGGKEQLRQSGREEVEKDTGERVGERGGGVTLWGRGGGGGSERVERAEIGEVMAAVEMLEKRLTGDLLLSLLALLVHKYKY